MDATKLESFIFEKMSATRLPGLSIALVRGGDVVYARGFGHADIASGRSTKPETLFGAASITKSFVAIAILQLAEKGLLKLTDPVDRFVPVPFKSKTGEPIRIEHLLTHTSGMPALGYIEAVLRHAHQIGGCSLPISGPRDVLTFAQGSDDWIESKPGERWFYLNEGYVLLSEIVERVSGVHYEKYVHDHILQPLGMSRTLFTEDDCCKDGDIATPYVLPREGGPPRTGRYLYRTLAGDAAMITNVLDLARYVQMFLRGGSPVLSADAYAAMTKGRVAVPGSANQYGYGVSITPDFLGETLVGHGGSLIVVTSHIAFMPKSNAGVAVMCNGNGYAMAQLAKVALAILLEREPEALPFVRSAKLLDELTGQYETYRGTLRVKLSKEGDLLRMEYLCGDQPPPPVTIIGENLDGESPAFFTIAEGQRLPIEFRRDGGKVEMIYERYKFRRTGPLV
jgi:CubicO group peptidase (beta-lactamase class C family)